MTTISRALVTIKHFKEKFNSSLRDACFSGVFRGGKEIATGLDTKEFIERARRDLQSIQDKIQADFELRCKVNAANNATMIEVAGQTMSISDALTYRMHVLPNLKQLYESLRNDIRNARSSYADLERTYQNKIDKCDDEMRALIEKREKPEIMKMDEVLEELKTKIDFFDLEFDAILTEKNPQIVLK